MTERSWRSTEELPRDPIPGARASHEIDCPLRRREDGSRSTLPTHQYEVFVIIQSLMSSFGGGCQSARDSRGESKRDS